MVILSPSHSNKHWQKALYLCFLERKSELGNLYKNIFDIIFTTKGRKKSGHCKNTVKNLKSSFAHYVCQCQGFLPVKQLDGK